MYHFANHSIYSMDISDNERAISSEEFFRKVAGSVE